MLAVIKLGGSQHIVKKDDVFTVNKLDSEIGSEIVVAEVLSLIDGKDIKVGTPLVEGSSVKLSVVDQTRDKKVIVFKKKRRQNYRRKNGHRQYITKVKVLEIN